MPLVKPLVLTMHLVYTLLSSLHFENRIERKFLKKRIKATTCPNEKATLNTASATLKTKGLVRKLKKAVAGFSLDHYVPRLTPNLTSNQRVRVRVRFFLGGGVRVRVRVRARGPTEGGSGSGVHVRVRVRGPKRGGVRVRVRVRFFFFEGGGWGRGSGSGSARVPYALDLVPKRPSSFFCGGNKRNPQQLARKN